MLAILSVLFLFYLSANAYLMSNFRKIALKMLRKSTVTSTPIPSLEIPLSFLEAKIEYSQFILPNGIKTTVVRDPISEKSACALAVGTGASDDFDGYAGLAHFTEHMLFLGTRKFPDENHYKKYITKHGGSSNAGTGMESTVYKFNVISSAFEGGIEIFSEFFKEPLFTSNSTSREILAVDAEDSKNRIIDGRRQLQVFKSLLLSDHKYAKFSTGNAQTLTKGNPQLYANETRNVMQQFYTQNYIPEKMSLSLVGPQSIEELTNYAYKYFATIPNLQTTATQDIINDISANNNIYTKTQEDFHTPIIPIIPTTITSSSDIFPFIETAKIIRIKPIKEIRDIAIVFALPPTRHIYKANPTRLLSHLISCKGPNSLFTILQQKGWITSVSGSTRTSFQDFSIFEISASLTSTGLEHWEEVVGSIFSHLRVIQSTSSRHELHRIWEEIKMMSTLEFEYSDKSSAYELAPALADNMLLYKMQHIMSVGSLLDDLPLDLFDEFLVRILDPLKSVILLRSPTFTYIPNDMTTESQDSSHAIDVVLRREQWYGVHYHDSPMQPYQINSWTTDVNTTPATQLPEVNPFIPYDLVGSSKFSHTVAKKLRSAPPVLVRQTVEEDVAGIVPRVDVWHSRDEAFGHPRATISILVDSPNCVGGHPVNSLVGSVFNQALADRFYPSAFAGLRYSVGLMNRGVSITVSGFSPKLSDFATDVADRFCSTSFWNNIPENIYTNAKDSLVRAIAGLKKERPDQLCDVYLKYLLHEGSWLPNERLIAAESICMVDVQRAALEALKRSKMTVYSHGDMSIESTLALADKIQPLLGETIETQALRSMQDTLGYGITPPRNRARILSSQHMRIALPGTNPDDENSALVCYIQTTTRAPNTTAVMMVIQKLLGEPLFNELRTKKSLGYIVSLGTSGYGVGMKTIRGFSVRVVSNKYSPYEIEKELGDFLSTQRQVMQTYTQDDIDQRVGALIKSIQDPPTSLFDEADIFWDGIVDETPFDWLDQVVIALQRLTISDVQQAAEKWLFDSSTRCSVSCMSFGSHHLDCIHEGDHPVSTGEAGFPLTTSLGMRVASIEELKIAKEALPYVL